jgi:alpha-soluble NSF attachment protein
MYRKCNMKKARECIAQGIAFYAEEGRFSMAAKYQKELAEMLEEEEDIGGTMEAYQSAADFYEGEGSVSSANQCLLKVAHYAALHEDYVKSIDIYDQVAASSLDNKLLKYGVKEYFLKATICHLASGVRPRHPKGPPSHLGSSRTL